MGLITIQGEIIGGQNIKTVNARELHAFLESKQQFGNWIRSRIEQYYFTQDVDFVSFNKIIKANGVIKTLREYHITLDMAKELSMVERNAKGKQARQYFIECERQTKESLQALPQNYTEALRHLLHQTEMNERQSLQIIEQAAKIEADRPKTVFANSITNSNNAILVRELAKLLRQNGIDTGEKRLYAWLRTNGYLIRKEGDDYNTPTQMAADLEIFWVAKTPINRTDGTLVKKTTKVTGKGQQYFINKFKEKGMVTI